jgi:geranylgeranyl diphosphate synthase type II
MAALSGELLEAARSALSNRLAVLLAGAGAGPERLMRAMEHSLLAPAKRVRAILTLVTAREFGGGETAAADLGCALEMVHAASLILDDLPAMDDAELRRGIPANHRVFGEATAILAAIGLLNRAFGVAAECEALDPAARLEAVEVLHRSIGVSGLVGGQEEDLHDAAAYTSVHELEAMYGRKTGALFAAAAELGVIAAGRSHLRAELWRFGWEIGVGFQILDDVVDAIAAPERAGKDVHQDEGRPSFPSLIGPSAARTRARAKIEAAIAAAAALAQQEGGNGRQLAAFTAHLTRAFDDILDAPGALVTADG